MAEDKKAGIELLEDVLRDVIGARLSYPMKMRAALALAELERGAFNEPKVARLTKIINGSAD